jgi:hypothetical protein
VGHVAAGGRLGIVVGSGLAGGAGRGADAGPAALLQAAKTAQEQGDEVGAFALLRVAIADDPEGQYRLALLLEQPRSRAQPDLAGPPTGTAVRRRRSMRARPGGSAISMPAAGSAPTVRRVGRRC